ncbi:rhodanese-related sulfurtransferase [Parasphingorhabdus halotolerans]|uniref:tRNA uridine(34) hydroxylase n=1 Tax=Parasphingorhabdus halotolerans TaxID=2725558 RepID=A0A6H2DMR6_9SPHN|nr:rhodanese-related sulfurtransferase [Parasphingorhabdus halotolerans]QJB69644.1 rhodanese-related sulfurtransferase [Parasphingorhabdus halotolerans]
MSNSQSSCKVAALYHFAIVVDPAAIRRDILEQCEKHGLKGTILLAPEGINGTIAGSPSGIDATISYLQSLPQFAGLEVKYSSASEMPFLRMKVRLKKEIVTMGVDGIDPARAKGKYVDPLDWNALTADPDTVIIDTRNTYEVAIGSFEGAINPQTESFRDFPAWFDAFAKELQEKSDKQLKIAMFCTGGIRCEKATAYVKSLGFDDVHHLKGGILKYLENVPEEQSRWNGNCFLFDQRVAVGHGLKESDYDQCHACRMPLNVEERASEQYIPGEACPHCYAERSDEQRARYRERQRQVEKAAKEGRQHLGTT